MTPDESIMMRCSDSARVLAFCDPAPVRYRHIIHNLNPPCPDWDRAMSGFYGKDPGPETSFYVDSHESISLLAICRDGKLQLEGDTTRVSEARLHDWCECLHPRGVATTHEGLMDVLCEVVGRDGWSQSPQYSVTAALFHDTATGNVVLLSPVDRDSYESFARRHADDPFLNEDVSKSSVMRDFAFMCEGLPVDCYAVFSGADIAGVITVSPMTNHCDEISVLFVAAEYRGRGLARILLARVTRDILARGKQPSYFAGGDPDILDRLLTGLGYHMTNQFLEWRYWW